MVINFSIYYYYCYYWMLSIIDVYNLYLYLIQYLEAVSLLVTLHWFVDHPVTKLCFRHWNCKLRNSKHLLCRMQNTTSPRYFFQSHKHFCVYLHLCITLIGVCLNDDWEIFIRNLILVVNSWFVPLKLFSSFYKVLPKK